MGEALPEGMEIGQGVRGFAQESGFKVLFRGLRVDATHRREVHLQSNFDSGRGG